MITQNEFVTEVEKWNNDKNVVHVRIPENDEHCVKLQFSKSSFKVNLPKTRNESYIVEFDGKARLAWIDELNMYCITKSGQVTPTKLISILHKQVQKLRDEDLKDPEIVQLTTLDNGIDASLSFDLEKYKKIKEIESLLSTSKSQIFTKSKSVSSSMFNQSIVGKMVTNEFMELWEIGKKKHQFTINVVDNNVYHWKIKFSNFQNKKLKDSLDELNKKFSYDFIEVDVHIHDTLYPNYPPVIKVIRPRLMNSLMHRLSNTKMLQLDYWTPTRSMTFVVNKLYSLLDKFSDVITDCDLNDSTKHPNGAFLKVEQILLDLASQVGVDSVPDIDDEKYENFSKNITPDVKTTKYSSTKSTVWASGTGYGHSSTTTWNVDAYLKSVEERDKLVQSNIAKLITELQECEQNKNDIIVVYDAVKHSVLINYLKSQLNGVTLLEINKHRPLFNLLFNLISNLANEHGINMFYDKDSKSLFEMFSELNTTCATLTKYKAGSDDSDDELIGMIMNVFSMVQSCYDVYMAEQISQENKRKEQQEEKITLEKAYVNKMKELRDKDEEYKIIDTNYHYQQNFNKDKGYSMPKEVIKRIRNEFAAFNSLPIDYGAIIISRSDKDYMSAVRTLMTGPEDTPYDCGVFLFDTYINTNFPNSPPNVWFLNTGGVRFNPNLYDQGKVCLSILGTWGGDKGGESWHKDNSHLIQIYTSILAQILIEKPYFNEPGYETNYNNASGLAQSETYNQDIRLYTMKHAMLDLIRNPKAYPQFTDVITAHFTMKKEKVIKVCTKWTEMATPNNKEKYQTVLNSIKVELENLK